MLSLKALFIYESIYRSGSRWRMNSAMKAGVRLILESLRVPFKTPGGVKSIFVDNKLLFGGPDVEESIFWIKLSV